MVFCDAAAFTKCIKAVQGVYTAGGDRGARHPRHPAHQALGRAQGPLREDQAAAVHAQEGGDPVQGAGPPRDSERSETAEGLVGLLPIVYTQEA